MQSPIIRPGLRPGMNLVPDGNGGVLLTFSAPGTPFDGQEVALPKSAAWRFVLMVLFLLRVPEPVIQQLEQHAPADARGKWHGQARPPA